MGDTELAWVLIMPFLTPNGDLVGECPKCHGTDNVIRNYGENHWGACEGCRVTWCIGYNLYSSWQNETEVDWLRNREYLSGFTVINADTLEVIQVPEIMVLRFFAPMYG